MRNLYHYFVVLPDRLYPFKCKIGGKIVRGQRSYEQAVNRALKLYGLNRLGYKLTLYREVFHLIGSITFILIATVVSKELFGSDTALYVLFGAAVVALFFQEFYVHPKFYGQHYQKSVVDWLAWVLPMASYFFLFR